MTRYYAVLTHQLCDGCWFERTSQKGPSKMLKTTLDLLGRVCVALIFRHSSVCCCPSET